jgi:transposase-like protein
MLAIHPNARTTPAVRAEIARSGEPSGVLAERYGVSAETVRKWRRRGPEDCRDHSSRPNRASSPSSSVRQPPASGEAAMPAPPIPRGRGAYAGRSTNLNCRT